MAKDNRFGWLLGAAGITGVLIALGYIVREAQGDLLGVSTYDPERAGYFLAAADLITHTILSLLDWPALVALVVGIALVAAVELGRSRSPRFQAARSWLALGVTCLCALHVLFFALPITPISNLLFLDVSLDRQFDASRIYEWRTEEVWKQVICSGVSQSALKDCGNRAPQDFRRDLEFAFSAAVAIAGLLWTLAWRILCFDPPLTEDAPKWRSIMPWEWSRTLLITLLCLTLFGLAYQYGKTAKSRNFPDAEVDFEDATAPKPSPPFAAPEGSTPPTSAGQAPTFLIVADNGTSTILYNTDPHHERVWVVRDTDIRSERISSLKDILRIHIENKMALYK
jgi:hypothetical protein